MKKSFLSMPMVLTIICVAMGIGLRWWRLGAESLWFDEGYTAWMAGNPAKEIIRLIRADTAPPLYYVTLRLWTLAFGSSEAALRSLSAVFSTITLLISIGLARRVAGAWPAVLAAALAAVSTMGIQYAHEARAYAMMAMLGMAAVAVVISHLDRPQRWKLPLIGMLTAAGLYTHNMAITYLPTLGILWWMVPPSPAPCTQGEGWGEGSRGFEISNLKLKMRDGLIICGITALLYLPWLVTSLHHQIHMVNQDFWVQQPTWASVADVIASLAGVEWWSIWRHVLDGWVPTIVMALLAVAAVMLLVGWVYSPTELATAANGGRVHPPYMPRQPSNRLGMALLLHALIPPLGIALYSCFGRPLLMDKVFLPSAAMLPVVFALVSKHRWGRVVALLMLVLAIGGAWGFMRNYYKEDWRAAVAAIQAYPPQRRLIVFVANDGQLPFDYYDPTKSLGDRTGVPAGFFDTDPPRTMLRVLTNSDFVALQHMLDIGNYPEVVLVYAHTGWSDPKQLTKAFLRSRYAVANDQQGTDIELIRYVR